MIVKLLTEHHLDFLSLRGGCRGSSESRHVKMSHCWKSHALAHMSSKQLYLCLLCSQSDQISLTLDPSNQLGLHEHTLQQ